MSKRNQQAYAAEQKAAGQQCALVLELLKLSEEEGLTSDELHALLYSKAGAVRRREFIRSGRTPVAAVLQHTIDCDANPFCPSGWKVEEHRPGGQLVWSKGAQAKAFYLSQSQQGGGVIEGNKLREELRNQPALNANVLDDLLAHPEQIPEEWKDKYVFFWGTIYRDSDGYLYVRCLCWDVGQWRWGCGWLDDDWRDGDLAAMPAS